MEFYTKGVLGHKMCSCLRLLEGRGKLRRNTDGFGRESKVWGLLVPALGPIAASGLIVS